MGIHGRRGAVAIVALALGAAAAPFGAEDRPDDPDGGVQSVCIINGGDDWKGRRGDPFSNGAMGYAMQGMGLLGPGGEPPTVDGNDLKQGEDTVGSVQRDARGNVTSYTNAAGTKRLYNVDTSATTADAFDDLAPDGTFTILKHGCLGGGSITLDEGKTYSGVINEGEGGNGTGIPVPDGAYELEGSRAKHVSYTVDVNTCCSSADPDGPGPQKSVTETFAGIDGVGTVTGNEGVVDKGATISYDPPGKRDAVRAKGAERAKKAGTVDEDGKGDFDAYVRSQTFGDIHEELNDIAGEVGDVAVGLDYFKEAQDDDADGAADNTSDYWLPLHLVGRTGAHLIYDPGPPSLAAAVEIPPAALAENRAVLVHPTLVSQELLPPLTGPVSAFIAIERYGLDPTLTFQVPVSVTLETVPGQPVLGAYHVEPGAAVTSIAWSGGPGSVTFDIDANGIYVVLGPRPLQPLGEGGLGGELGVPVFDARGTLEGGSLLTLELENVPAFSTSWLVVGIARLDAPFKGGLLVPDPNPPGLLLALPTGAAGHVLVTAPWPVGFPPSFEIFLQWWTQDPAGPVGFSTSEAWSGTTP